MKFISNIPDAEHVPYPILEADPHIKTLVRYFRPSDYAVMAGATIGFPAAFALWEWRSPTIHPRFLPRFLAIQVPCFAAVGFVYAARRSYGA
ncbi:hypothetical protein HK405_009336 [Cladochytrium tenue]|nr:hypothetical protein HK405_009336 [Cladochytrium tenue]